MAKIKCIKKVGKANVYNLYVEKNNNFVVNGGLVVHNCDALRYACTSYTFTPDGALPPPKYKEFNYAEFALTPDVIDLEETGDDFFEMGCF